MVTYHRSTLDNDLQIVSASCPYWRSLSLGIFAAAGSRHDPALRQGLAHFTEHMLFKGTAKRSAKKIALQAESVGGHLNAYTSEEHTCYHVRSPANQLPRMVTLLADMYGNSVFPELEIQRERQVIEDEIHMYRDEPSSHIDDLLSATVWPKHALGRPILGTLRSLARIERDHFFSHLKQSYGARNSVVAIAGPQSHEAMEAKIAEQFSSLARGRRRPTRTITDSSRHRPLVDAIGMEERGTEQVHLRIAFPTQGREDAQLYPSRLLSVLLGETMSSRLSQELREKRGYCYSLGCSREVFQDTGLFTIHACFEPKFLSAVFRQIFRQLKLLRERPPSRRELLAAYRFVAGNHEMGLEETSTQMFWLGDAALHRDEELNPQTYLERLSQVGPEHIQATARELFSPDNLHVALLGPDLKTRRAEIADWCCQDT
jgi:predicted Zn-dependent peptidase